MSHPVALAEGSLPCRRGYYENHRVGGGKDFSVAPRWMDSEMTINNIHVLFVSIRENQNDWAISAKQPAFVYRISYLNAPGDTISPCGFYTEACLIQGIGLMIQHENMTICRL